MLETIEFLSGYVCSILGKYVGDTIHALVISILQQISCFATSCYDIENVHYLEHINQIG